MGQFGVGRWGMEASSVGSHLGTGCLGLPGAVEPAVALLPCGMWLWLKECNRICISVGTVTFGVEADGAGQGSEEPALSLEWTVSRCKARLRDVAVGAKLNRRLGLDREGMPG